MKKVISAIVTLSLLGQPLASLAAECSVKSGVTVTPLLELYTSEGCSSCPPADKWLSRLKLDKALNEKVVPLAFHVDYWDRLGWKDPFGSEQHSNRQYWLAKVSQSRNVYTPQFVVNGQDYRGWAQSDRLQKTLNQYNQLSQTAKANISLQQKVRTGEREIFASAGLSKVQSNADFYIAVYENNLKSSITAGENQGVNAVHDFVVRALYGPFPLTAQTELTKNFNLPTHFVGIDGGVASFVQDRKTGDILQALKLPFCS